MQQAIEIEGEQVLEVFFALGGEVSRAEADAVKGKRVCGYRDS
jgi:hypothetical protein